MTRHDTPNGFAVVNPRGGTRRGWSILEQVRPVFAAAAAELDVRSRPSTGHAREIARTANLEGYDGFVRHRGRRHDPRSRRWPDAARRDPPRFRWGSSRRAAATPCTSIWDARTRWRPRGGSSRDEPVRWTCRGHDGRASGLLRGHHRLGRSRRHQPHRGEASHASDRRDMQWPPMAHPAPKRRRARLILDGQAIEDEFLFVIGCNTKFTGKGMQLAPRAKSATARSSRGPPPRLTTPNAAGCLPRCLTVRTSRLAASNTTRSAHSPSRRRAAKHSTWTAR